MGTVTNGEKWVSRLLSELPKKRYFFRYEPQINTADGQSCKPDFILISALYGVVIIEVKDWVKLDGGDQENIRTQRADGKPMTHPNPVRTAEGYAYALRRLFEERAELWTERRGRRALKFPWQVMVVLPNIPEKTISRFVENHIWPHGTVIGRESLESPAHFERAVQQLPWKFRLERPLTADTLDILREVIDPSLTVHDADARPIGILTMRQETLVREPLKSVLPQQIGLPGMEHDVLPSQGFGIAENATVRLVRGVAGSGKTLVLIQRAHYLAEQYPETRLLIIVHNVDLAEDMKRRIGSSFSNIEVTNFHKICARILKPHWRTPISSVRWIKRNAQDILEKGFSAEFLADEFGWRKETDLFDDEAYLRAERHRRTRGLDRTRREWVNEAFRNYLSFQEAERAKGHDWYDWEDVPLLAAAELTEAHELFGAYDAILIDEGQDFAPTWFRVIKRLLKANGSLFICDDPSQSIFRAYTWVQKGVPVIGRTRTLNVPFRSTREISEAAHSLVEADETLRTTEGKPEPDFTSYELGSGPLPWLIACQDEAAETAFVAEKTLELLDSGLPAHQIAILVPHSSELKRWTEFEARGVYARTYERMKGMEFAAVFVPHLHSAFAEDDDAEAVSAMRRKIFTAMTRARVHLTLTYHGMLPAPLTPLLEHMWCESRP